MARAEEDGPAGDQLALSLPAPPARDPEALVPVRMVNEYVYCPRLAWLEWVHGEWADNADTQEGRAGHRRVDARPGTLPDADDVEDDDTIIHARSVALTSERLGVTGVLDLVEGEGDIVAPVDYKRGKRPHVKSGAHDPERVQLCLQGILLEEHGYRCPEGFLYFKSSRERVRIPFDDELRQLTLDSIHGLRLAAASPQPPPPLIDSPKCPRCSLVGICLPDELGHLAGTQDAPRPLAVGQTEAMPLYVQRGHGKIGRKGDQLEVRGDDEPAITARLAEISELVLFGNISVTAPALHECMRREIPVSWHSHSGWFLGHTTGLGHRTAATRLAQFETIFDPVKPLRLARALIAGKIRNSRTLLRRNHRGEGKPEQALLALKHQITRAREASATDSLLGVEGTAAAIWFGAFPDMLGRNEFGTFDFTRRNRRPPADPVNAMLSFAYTLLLRKWHVALSAVGLDPYCGIYHTPGRGRPSLALDMMEPDRPLIADSAVLGAINNGELGPRNFVTSRAGCALTPTGRKALIAAFERRLEQEFTHPVFGYRISYRRAMQVQARLLVRHLQGEVPGYTPIMPR